MILVEGLKHNYGPTNKNARDLKLRLCLILRSLIHQNFEEGVKRYFFEIFFSFHKSVHKGGVQSNPCQMILSFFFEDIIKVFT